MNRSLSCLVLATSLLGLASGAAHAQSSPATCVPYEPGGELLVLVNGQATTIESTTGGVLVNGVFCGWPSDISMIRITGGNLADSITLRGAFVPGHDAEPDWDELELLATLGGGTDTITVEFGETNDTAWVASGIVGFKNDQDYELYSDAEIMTLKAMGGDDSVFANGSTFPTLYLYGGEGNDWLEGDDSGNDLIEGGAGNDNLRGGGGDDRLIGGPGSDVFNGGAGNDTADYTERTAALTVTIGDDPGANDGEVGEQDDVWGDVESVWGGEGNDVLIGNELGNTLSGGGGADRLDGRGAGDYLVGGPGLDTVDYSSRTGNVLATIGNGMQDDGEVGEFDEVEGTVENVTGGAGNDTIVGTSARNTLRGGGGNDNLTGQGGNDTLYGDAGDDSILAGAGGDRLYGGAGSDVLDGEAGADTYTAGGGNDFIYNDDGVAETVNCGAGTDDAEVDTGATDTFIGCEL